MEQIKEEIIAYWSSRTDDFSALRERELQSPMRKRWEQELLSILPEKTGLRILDAGTGSGFLAILLAAMGHQVVGIDMTESMCRHAEMAAQKAGVQADFFAMDAENPKFPGESFDMIVSRNLTWNLPHLAETYMAWHRLLKPGGMLVNFDGDYCHERPMEELVSNHAHQSVGKKLQQDYEHFKRALAVGQGLRPAWDMVLLRQAGFEKISVDSALSKRIYPQIDEFYNPTPMFTIQSYKRARPQVSAERCFPSAKWAVPAPVYQPQGI